jgi:hypothetical protein
MTSVRRAGQLFLAYGTLEGAGVRLHRAFGYEQVPLLDPFLMLDDFRAVRPEDYLAGFPWHPHRGIETVTYMLEGRVEHGDSLGHAGNVRAGDIQWMTAGSGIIHQEMPKPVDGRMGGFQLWVNLPKSHKMMAPRYQDIDAAQIPAISFKDDVTVRVICGTVAGVHGPVHDIVADPEYLDVTIGAGGQFSHPVKPVSTAVAYVIAGAGTFDPYGSKEQENRMAILFGKGSSVEVHAGPKGVRFLFFSDTPFQEPIAWGGQIVMNTQEELRQAFAEYKDGTFIKKGSSHSTVHPSG